MKIEGLDLEGRERAAVLVGWADDRRDVSWEVKARVEEEAISFAREFFGRGIP